MEPLHNTLYIIVAPAIPRLGEPPGYYAPVSEEAYQAGVTLPGLKPAPGWEVVKTDDYLYPLYSSQTNKRLRKMGIDIRPGDGLKAYQQAAIEFILPADTTNILRNVCHYIDRAKSLNGITQIGAIDSPVFTKWRALVGLGWFEEIPGGFVPTGLIRNGYRLTRVGFEVVNIMAAVYGW